MLENDERMKQSMQKKNNNRIQLKELFKNYCTIDICVALETSTTL